MAIMLAYCPKLHAATLARIRDQLQRRLCPQDQQMALMGQVDNFSKSSINQNQPNTLIYQCVLSLIQSPLHT